jgi:hypothetical protein
VWTYDTNPGWKHYIPNGPDNNLSTIVPEKAYWIDMTEDAVLTIVGSQITNTVVHLYQGLNLAGYNSISTQSRQDALSSISGKYIYIYTYDNLTGSWSRYVVGSPNFFNNLTQLKPNQGYLIYTSVACDWTVST